MGRGHTLVLCTGDRVYFLNIYDQVILKTNEEILITHGRCFFRSLSKDTLICTIKSFHLFFPSDSEGFGLSGREKGNGKKEPELAWIIFQTMMIKTTIVEGFLFYTVFFHSN